MEALRTGQKWTISGVDRPYGKCTLNFLRNSWRVLQSVSIIFFSTNNTRVPVAPSLANIWHCQWPFTLCKMIPISTPIVTSARNFSCVWWPSMSPFVKCLFKSFAHILGCLPFYNWVVESSYVPNTSLLLVGYINIFSHFMACLILFTKLKFLILM